MVATAREFFLEQSRGQASSPLLAGVHGTYDFAIGDRDHWYVNVDDGHVNVTQAADPSTPPDCTITCSEEDFVGFVNGERNMIPYVIRGRVKLAGDLSLAQTFNNYVRSRLTPARTKGGRP